MSGSRPSQLSILIDPVTLQFLREQTIFLTDSRLEQVSAFDCWADVLIWLRLRMNPKIGNFESCGIILHIVVLVTYSFWSCVQYERDEVNEVLQCYNL